MSDVPDRDEVVVEETNGSDRPRRRRLLSISVLPTLCTVGNGLAGFAAVHFATREAAGYGDPGHLANAAWMLVLAMVFDMLDGRLARMTRNTSDFGGQLDSLCDAISFGLAPAILMLRTVQTALRGAKLGWLSTLGWMGEPFTLPDRILWAIGGLYVACAVLRLARFNVENEPGEQHHMTFKGLPSPGAASSVIALVILLNHLHASEETRTILSSEALFAVVVVALPLVTLCAALLMVSNIGYPHVTNQLQISQKPFGTIVKVVAVALAIVLLGVVPAAAVIALLYVFSGPVRHAWHGLRDRRKAA